MRKRIWSLSVLAATALAACALSPQVVSVRPALETAEHRTIGEGTRLALNVVDARPSSVIGQRGGVYEKTASIRTEGDVAPAVRRELVRALEAVGFSIPEAGGPADAALTVEVASIVYTARGGTFVRGVDTSATVRAEARRGSRTFTGRYRGTQTKNVMTAPGADENEALINAAVSNVLQRLVADAELLGFLAGGG
ncbi:MAG: hypothetical protein GWN84_07185 [Gammaproteobacteria bacterium]|nr:hypothetical protein [Gammaproteobacteria bacterium]NIR82670.1 hypothetical protein [Gammaproteobacteria bacterium]NIR89377.1 hypothetical protein [Gammaproteobacteria bacterium]NIU03818.1 hypothetical protein [Gammaproteobacteria bacterium]NIV51152.1 hypothetical protein [Gammaproteobacteria bacterium]